MLGFFRRCILLVSLSAVLSCTEIFGIKCPPLDPPYGGHLFYNGRGNSLKCEYPVGTLVSVKCDEFRVIEGNGTSTCLESGNWSTPFLKCIPDCGKLGLAVSLIVHGSTARLENVPWNVAIYHRVEHGDGFELWCGGTLISDTAVVTAAHCVWQVNLLNLRLAVGKFYRDFNASEVHAQILRIRKIEILETYQGALGNYNGDIAVIFSAVPVKFNSYVRPACLDWNQSLMEAQLKEGNYGRVAGWGLTESNTYSNYLRVVHLPFASYERCFSQKNKIFRKHVTYTAFCAGYANGTSVCNGDSGGGLLFHDNSSERWYLQGLVSIGPRRRGTSFCDPRFYTIFTKVTIFLNWVKSLNIFEVNINRRKSGHCESKE